MSSYDPKQFAVLLKKAIGDRAVKQFAEEAGMSRFQISRRLSCQLQTPPRKKTLSLIASIAQDGVTYNDLLISCGYEPEPEPSVPGRLAANEVKLAKASVLSSINELGVSCRINADTPQIPCDFEIQLDFDEPLCWDFTCIPSSASAQTVEQILDKNYLELMYRRLNKYSKLSFVTGSQNVFSACTAKCPMNLDANVSLVLCSPGTLDIAKEQDLSKSTTNPLPEGVVFFKN